MPESVTESVDFPGRGLVKVIEDVLSMPTHSSQIGQENDAPVFDRHLYYSRHIVVNAADGRTIAINVQGRTNLAKAVSGPVSLDIEGESFLSMEMLVTDGKGSSRYVAHDGGGNSLNEAIPACAGSGGFAGILLERGQPGAAFMDAAIAKANTMLPATPVSKSESAVEVIRNGGGAKPSAKSETREEDPANVGPLVHIQPENANTQGKAWGDLSKDEKRKEVWNEFKGHFSWGNVGIGVAIGLGVLALAFGAASIPAAAALAVPVLGIAAIVTAILMILGPILSGKNPSLATWIKGGFMALAGIFTILAVVAASPEIMLGLVLAGVGYIVVEIIESVVSYGEAVSSPSREAMKAKASEAAKQAEQSIIDVFLAALPVKGFKAWSQRMRKQGLKPDAPGEEGMTHQNGQDGAPVNDEAGHQRGQADIDGPGNDQFVTETGQVIESQFWDSPKIINGRKVYQRQDLFDPNFVDKDGFSNVQLMGKGNAPIGYDGDPVNIHHLIHVEPGAVAEVGGQFHRINTRTLHFQPNGKSFRTHNGRKSSWPKTRSGNIKQTDSDKAFERWRKNYWRYRSQGFLN
jgi:hypothetical protein